MYSVKIKMRFLILCSMIIKCFEDVNASGATTLGPRGEPRNSSTKTIGELMNEMEKAGSLGLAGTERPILSNVTAQMNITKRHCNYPIYEEETEIPKGYKLISASVLFRHADRSPKVKLEDYPSHMKPPNFTLSVEDDEKFQEHLNFLHHCRAQGENRMLYMMSDVRNGYKGATLTPRGAIQLVRLGERLRELYGNHTFFNDSKIFDLYTTTTARTYQSAQAFLHGFLGYHRACNIDIKLTVENNNPAFCLSDWCTCQRGKRDKRSFSDQTYLITRNLQAIYDTQLTDNVTLPDTVDRFIAYICNKQNEMPCGRSICLTEEMLDLASDHMNEQFKREYSEQHFISHTIYMSAVILRAWNQLGDQLEVNQNETPNKRFVFFSGHANTVSAVRNSLGIFDGVVPPFASSLRFEVYQQTHSASNASKPYIRFVYNGQDVTSKVHFCRQCLNADGLCDFQALKNFTETHVGISGYLNGTAVSNLCGRSSS